MGKSWTEKGRNKFPDFDELSVHPYKGSFHSAIQHLDLKRSSELDLSCLLPFLLSPELAPNSSPRCTIAINYLLLPITTSSPFCRKRRPRPERPMRRFKEREAEREVKSKATNRSSAHLLFGGERGENAGKSSPDLCEHQMCEDIAVGRDPRASRVDLSHCSKVKAKGRRRRRDKTIRRHASLDLSEA